MAELNYTPFATVESGGGGGSTSGVRSNPNQFGAQVGAATEKAANESFQLTEQFAKQASEAKANDTIANQWTPKSVDLRNRYDLLRGPDKIAGYDNYIKSLQETQKALEADTENRNPYEKQILNGYITRQIIQEQDSAKRALVESQKQFEDQAHYDIIKTQSGQAADNYNNPALVTDIAERNDALITKHYMDNGHAADSGAIEQEQRAVRGDMATSMIKRAVDNNDNHYANEIRAEYAKYIPGFKQLQIDGILRAANVRQSSDAAISAIKNGEPIPNAVGAPPVQLRASVARSAQNGGVNPNTALAYLSIESANGTNLGKRGTILQDKEGGTIDEQVARVPAQIKAAEESATAALGRPAEPWEGYVVHQQGSGGGASLLKDAQKPLAEQARAIDVLRQYEGKEKGYSAYKAIVENGGNTTMTSGQFLNFIHATYTSHAKGSEIQLASNDGVMSDAGQAILAPHEQTSPVMQPAATPVQALMNYDQMEPEILSRINSIPNLEIREGVLEAHKRDRAGYVAAASAYKSNLVNQAAQLAVSKDFTSMDQVPPEMIAALATDSPQTITYMQNRAEYNLNHASGATTKDEKEYGVGFYSLFNKVHSTGSDAINDITQLQGHVGRDGDLTIAGYDKLVKEVQGKGTPEGSSEGEAKKAFFAAAKSQISGENQMTGLRDPKGDLLYSQFLIRGLAAYDKGKAEGKTSAQLLSEDSPDYIGKIIPTFKRPYSVQLDDITEASVGISSRTAIDVAKDIKSGKITRAAGKVELEGMGIKFRPDGPSVPKPE